MGCLCLGAPGVDVEDARVGKMMRDDEEEGNRLTDAFLVGADITNVVGEISGVERG